jgi:hypothetical protein
MISVKTILEILAPYVPISFSQPPIPPSTATNIAKNEVVEDQEKEKRKRHEAILKSRSDINQITTTE